MFRNETNYVLTNGVLLDGTEKHDAADGQRSFTLRAAASAAVADAAARLRGL